MARPQQRYRGVRQRHWGSWVSEIRHPLLKTRIWLGTFETAHDAAKAYDEAARIMCGPSARTNFSYGPDEPPSSSSSSGKLLSDTLMAKLQKCQAKSQSISEKLPAPDPKPNKADQCLEIGNKNEKINNINDEKDENRVVQELKSVEDDYQIEQMIQELLDRGPVEVSSVEMANSSSI